MDTQAGETFPDLGAFASAIGFVTVPPPSERVEDIRPKQGAPTREESEFERAQGAVLEYLRAHVLEGEASGIKDRIQVALFDDVYHRLTARAGATVPIMKVEEMLEAEDASVLELPSRIHVAEKFRERLLFAIHLQGLIVRATLAEMSQPQRRVRRKRMAVPTAKEQLAFVYDPSLSAVIKEAALAGWIGPMCSSAVYASSSDTSDATIEVLLEQWIESMQRHLALWVAAKKIPPLPVEILPVEFQLDFAKAIGHHLERLGHVIQKLGQLDRQPHPESPAGNR